MIYIGPETKKAIENFPLSGEKHDSLLIKAFAMVKLACCNTNKALGYLETGIAEAIASSCQELIDGNHWDMILTDPMQGGAGTSLNMNFNEVIAYLANQSLGNDTVSPLDHVNLHQSTNDVFPTAVKVAVLLRLKELEQETAKLQEALQFKEQEFSGVIKLGRTELMDAVPMTLGMEFGAFAEAVARDRWRIFKCRERIKTVNLGGTAIGTGLGAPRDYILKVNDELKRITGLSVSRSENTVDSTQNLDTFVEVSGILKAMAVNLFKISNDLRLLASGPEGGLAEIQLPEVQKGSSIMPGKVNPVIPEAISQVAIQVMNNDNLVALTAGLGQLELNHYMPLLSHTILKSLKLLTNSAIIFSEKCINGITANKNNCLKHLMNSKSIATYLIPKFGYNTIEKIINMAVKEKKTVKEVLLEEGLLTDKAFEQFFQPQRMYKLGYTADDYKED
jgi:aspartate ammonia-lyase